MNFKDLTDREKAVAALSCDTLIRYVVTNFGNFVQSRNDAKKNKAVEFWDKATITAAHRLNRSMLGYTSEYPDDIQEMYFKQFLNLFNGIERDLQAEEKAFAQERKKEKNND